MKNYKHTPRIQEQITNSLSSEMPCERCAATFSASRFLQSRERTGQTLKAAQGQKDTTSIKSTLVVCPESWPDAVDDSWRIWAHWQGLNRPPSAPSSRLLNNVLCSKHTFAIALSGLSLKFWKPWTHLRYSQPQKKLCKQLSATLLSTVHLMGGNEETQKKTCYAATLHRPVEPCSPLCHSALCRALHFCTLFGRLELRWMDSKWQREAPCQLVGTFFTWWVAAL